MLYWKLRDLIGYAISASRDADFLEKNYFDSVIVYSLTVTEKSWRFLNTKYETWTTKTKTCTTSNIWKSYTRCDCVRVQKKEWYVIRTCCIFFESLLHYYIYILQITFITKNYWQNRNPRPVPPSRWNWFDILFVEILEFVDVFLL